jgi:kinesin family member 1
MQADRAKQIKTRAIINEDPTEKLIKSLQEENARLKKALESGGVGDVKKISSTTGSAEDDEASLKRQLEENNKAMEDMKLSYEEKLKKAQDQVKIKLGLVSYLTSK